MSCLSVSITPIEGAGTVQSLYSSDDYALYSSDDYALATGHYGNGIVATLSTAQGMSDVSITPSSEGISVSITAICTV